MSGSEPDVNSRAAGVAILRVLAYVVLGIALSLLWVTDDADALEVFSFVLSMGVAVIAGVAIEVALWIRRRQRANA